MNTLFLNGIDQFYCGIPMTKSLNEKDFFMELLDEQGIQLTLHALGENAVNGAAAFRKTKIRQWITRGGPNKGGSKSKIGTPWDFLCEKLKMTKYENFSPREMINEFVSPELPIPDVCKMLTLRGYHRHFFDQYFEEMRENVREGRYFLTGISGVETEEEFVRDVLTHYEKKTENLRESIGELVKRYRGDKDTIARLEDKFQDVSCLEFDQIRHEYESEYNPALVLIAFVVSMLKRLEDGDETATHDLVRALYFEALHRAWVVEIQLRHENDDFEEEAKRWKEKYEALQGKVKETKEEKNDKSKKQVQQLQVLVKELEPLKEKYTALETQYSALQLREKELSESVQSYDRLFGHFDWNLQTTYHHRQIVVIHALHEVYLSRLFPDITFLTSDQVDRLDQYQPKEIWVQQSGLSYSKKKSIIMFAKRQQVQLKELRGLDERDLIMEMSAALLA